MIFENNGLDLTDASLLEDELGATWSNFTASITPFNAYTFNTSYNLIKISYPDTGLGQTILEMLIDELTHTTEKTINIRNVLMTNIIDLLTKFGIFLDQDIITIDHLPLLNKLIDLIYTLDGFEDLLALSEVLESKDIPPPERFLRVFAIVNDLDDIDDYEHLVMDVSENTLETLRLSLITHDDVPEVQKHVVDRVRGNREFLKGTLAWQHVVEGGNLGGSLQVLLDSWKKELGEFEVDDQLVYVKNVIGLVLLSETENGNILNAINDIIKVSITDSSVIFKTDAMIKNLKLGD